MARLAGREPAQWDYLFKIVIIGDSNVGKSNLMLRFTKNEFEENLKQTIGVEFGSRTMTIIDKVVKAQVWDTAGQERFRSITNAFYRGSQGALIVYDITKRKSFERLQPWLKEVQAGADYEKIVVMIIGNKCDLQSARQVKTEEGLEYAKKVNAIFMETSALDSTNVNESFTQIIHEILDRQPASKPSASGIPPKYSKSGLPSSTPAGSSREHFLMMQEERSRADRIDIRPVVTAKKASSKKKCC